jgi:hypothetical protein
MLEARLGCLGRELRLGSLDYCNCLQSFSAAWHTQFLYQIPPKLPGSGIFSVPSQG